MVNIGVQIFYSIWQVLNVFFLYIDGLFRSLFDAIPAPAITFLIGIVCYSLLEFLVFFINREEKGNKKLFLKVLYGLSVIIVILFSIWRFGIISQIDSTITFETMTEFLINIIYMLFAIILIVSFLKKITWLRKAILVLLWSLFFIATFITSTIFDGFNLTNTTLLQFLLVGLVFGIPFSMTKYQKAKKSGVD